MPDAGYDVLRSVGIYKDARPSRGNDATTAEQTRGV